MKKQILSSLTVFSLFLVGCSSNDELSKVDESLIVIYEDEYIDDGTDYEDFYLLNDNEQTLLVSFSLDYIRVGNPDYTYTITDELIVEGHSATKIERDKNNLEEEMISYEIISWIIVE